MQKIMILNCLRKQKINYYLDHKLFEVRRNGDAEDSLNIDLNGYIEDQSNNNLARETELEKFLEDYYNNAIYGTFFNLKI